MTVRDSAPVAIAAGATATATVSCAAGERAVGGGGITGAGLGTLTNSFATDDPPTGWEVDYRDATATDATVVAIVVCASP